MSDKKSVVDFSKSQLIAIGVTSSLVFVCCILVIVYMVVACKKMSREFENRERDFNDALASKQDVIENNQAEISAKNAEIGALKDRISVLEATVTVRTEEFRRHVGYHASYVKEIASVERKIADAERVNADLQSEAKANKEQIERLKNEIQTMQKLNEDQASQNNVLNAQFEQEKSKMKRLVEDLDKKTKEQADTSKALQQMRDDFKLKSQSVEDLERVRANLNLQLQEKANEQEALISKLREKSDDKFLNSEKTNILGDYELWLRSLKTMYEVAVRLNKERREFIETLKKYRQDLKDMDNQLISLRKENALLKSNAGLKEARDQMTWPGKIKNSFSAMLSKMRCSTVDMASDEDISEELGSKVSLDKLHTHSEDTLTKFEKINDVDVHLQEVDDILQAQCKHLDDKKVAVSTFEVAGEQNALREMTSCTLLVLSRLSSALQSKNQDAKTPQRRASVPMIKVPSCVRALWEHKILL